MWSLNSAYGREETRGFVKRRLTGLAMVFLMLFAFVLVFGLLVLGPLLSGWIGSTPSGWRRSWSGCGGRRSGRSCSSASCSRSRRSSTSGRTSTIPRWTFLTFGTVISVVVWLLASGAFSVYVSQLGSFNKAWGSLAAVIIMLTWLWISGLALLFGAEVNAEAERSRELRRGEPASVELQAPPKD